MFKLALRNITRHKVRTAMTLFAVVAGVASLIVSGGFIHDIFLQLREFTIHSQTGHIQIHKQGYYQFGTQAPNKYIISDPKVIVDKLARHEEVDEVMSRLRFSGLINNGKADHAIIGEGVEPAKELKLGTYIELVAGRQLQPEDRFGVVVGEGVAQVQQLSVGDRVTVLLNTKEGALNNLDFEVVGIFRTFSKEFDGRAVRISLEAAQELLSTTGVNSIVLSLKESESTDEVFRRIAPELEKDGYELKAWHQLNDFYSKTVDLYDRQFGVLRLIILGIAGGRQQRQYERHGTHRRIRDHDGFGQSASRCIQARHGREHIAGGYRLGDRPICRHCPSIGDLRNRHTHAASAKLRCRLCRSHPTHPVDPAYECSCGYHCFMRSCDPARAARFQNSHRRSAAV
jgi:ABC-type lipoprotein release transport system permease subunit